MHTNISVAIVFKYFYLLTEGNKWINLERDGSLCLTEIRVATSVFSSACHLKTSSISKTMKCRWQMNEWAWVISRMMLTGESQHTRWKTFADRLARKWTRTFAVRGQWRAAWSMAQPANFSVYQSRNACEIILDIRRDFLLPLKYRRRNKRIFCFVEQQYLR
jgi:hypothetical protein